MLLCLLTSSKLFSLLIAFMAFGMSYEYLTMPSKAGIRFSPAQGIAYSLGGVLYILCGLAFMIVLAFRGGEFSGLMPLCFFLMIWASDVGAYCVGSTIGQVLHSRKHSPDIHGLVKGLMIESYLVEGCQKVGEGVYGKSITDPCLGWEDSEALIYTIAEMC